MLREELCTLQIIYQHFDFMNMETKVPESQAVNINIWDAM